MRITEIAKPKLIKLHYFNVDNERSATELGLKQDRNGRWYLPQYNTSGSGFDRAATSAIRVFGRPQTVTLS
jgi:hypothetical protein